MSFFESQTPKPTVGYQIIRASDPANTVTGGYALVDDIEVKKNEAKQWGMALLGTLDQLVADAGKPQRDSSILAITQGIMRFSAALQAVVDAVYEKEVKE